MSPTVNYDPREIPPHRRDAKRLERPIRAYRAWGLGLRIFRSDCGIEVPRVVVEDAWLESIGIPNSTWKEPVVHAHTPPDLPRDLAVGCRALDCGCGMTRELPLSGSTEMCPGCGHSIDLHYHYSADCWNAGLYALKSPYYVRREILRDYAVEVWGTVEIWGRVVEHELGYRAEHALVVGLCVQMDRLERRGFCDGASLLSLANSYTIQEIQDALERRFRCRAKIVRRSRSHG